MAETLKPCPFCGGKAEIIHIDEGENAGGSCVCCTQCLASSNVEFEFKENFVSNWNHRSDAKVAELVSALEPFAAFYEKRHARYVRRGGSFSGFPDSHPSFDIAADKLELPLGVWRAAARLVRPSPEGEANG